MNHPLLVEFVPGTRLQREPDRVSDLPIHRNGPPGTFVVFPHLRVSLPTDQIVFVDEAAGAVRVGFGGMRFRGLEHGLLVFERERDLQPESELSPDRSWTMTLDETWVAAVVQDGVHVWPR